jgi:predicted PurR-regulated permease PerM
MLCTLLIVTVLLFALIRIMSLVMTELNALRVSTSDDMDLIEEGTEWLNAFFTRIKIPARITPSQVINNVQAYISQILTFLLSFVRSIGSLSVGVLINLVIFYGLLFLVTPGFDDLLDFLTHLSPFDPAMSERFILRAFNTAKAMVWGMLIIAVVQGGLAGLILTVLGVENILLLSVIVAVFSFIPLLGTGMVTLPIAVIFFTEGAIFKGILLTLVQVILIGNIDTVLRAQLIPRDVRMPLVISFIAILGGLALFGIWGLVYGPVIFSMLLSAIEVIQQSRVPAVAPQAAPRFWFSDKSGGK